MFFENATLEKAKLILAQDLKKYLRLHLSTQINEKKISLIFQLTFFCGLVLGSVRKKKVVEKKTESFPRQIRLVNATLLSFSEIV